MYLFQSFFSGRMIQTGKSSRPFSGCNGRPLVTEATSIHSLQITGNIRNEMIQL